MARMPDIPCSACGALLWSSSTSLPAESRVCRPCRERRRAAAWTTSCAECGGVLAQRYSREQRFCSLTCAYASRKGVAPLWALQASRRPRPCADCGIQVATTGAVALCSPCADVRKLEGWRRKNRARRTALRSVASEPYTLAEIAGRDGHRCQLCHREVDMQVKAPHSLSPSIDHVVPLARGGDDTRGNVQLAHRGCNSRKGASDGPRQTALVG
ncbi:HNH endonuclease [Sphaerisporangium sp. NBC_01403]|uniref:HNH endonuclease n=1 Tax=Sphaerisporangium sp. NBC_01403 TaxID=2903599 RepID=UPI003863C494